MKMHTLVATSAATKGPVYKMSWVLVVCSFELVWNNRLLHSSRLLVLGQTRKLPNIQHERDVTRIRVRFSVSLCCVDTTSHNEKWTQG